MGAVGKLFGMDQGENGILPDLVLEDCMFLGIYPFYPGCPVCWHIVVHNIFLESFVFGGGSCYFSLNSHCIYWGSLSLSFSSG